MPFLGKISFRDPATFYRRLGPRGLRFAKIAHNNMANNLVAEIKRTAPRKTGEYAASWRKGPSSARRVEVRTTKPKLFEILEFVGSQPHVIRPVRAKALRFEQAGQVRFAKSVNHPGFPPIPHVRPALRKIERGFPRELRRVMRGQWNA